MAKIKVCASSRIYSWHKSGSFSTTSMIDYMSDMGFDGVDMSFDSLSATDDGYAGVAYATSRRAEQKGLEIPSCHLPFYMPNPEDATLMSRFSNDLRAGIDTASKMKIPLAVIHPIAHHAVRSDRERWIRANIDFLSPLNQYAKMRGVELCIENMASTSEEENDHLFGSSAEEILTLANTIGTSVCWDFGHANVSRRPTGEFEIFGDKLKTVHAHDNNSFCDSHDIPFEGTVDWNTVAQTLAKMGYDGYINVEIRAWDAPSDKFSRDDIGRRAEFAGKKLAKLVETYNIGGLK